MIDSAKRGGQLADAASSGSAHTVMANNRFHIDRQTSTNAQGSHKVAIQTNKGKPSTIGQVVIHPEYKPSAKLVSEFIPFQVICLSNFNLGCRPVETLCADRT